ncbi:hypothetical protein C1N87_26620 (plasmid) [Priestia aryabhattai]
MLTHLHVSARRLSNGKEKASPEAMTFPKPKPCRRKKIAQRVAFFPKPQSEKAHIFDMWPPKITP